MKQINIIVLIIVFFSNTYCSVSRISNTCQVDEDCHFLDQICVNSECMMKGDASITDAPESPDAWEDPSADSPIEDLGSCERGEKICNNSGGYNECVADGGSTYWVSHECESYETCDAGGCICGNPCTGSTQKECNGLSRYRQCEAQVSSGCFAWSADSYNCPEGFECQGEAPDSNCNCRNQCSVQGVTQCAEDKISICNTIEGTLCLQTQTCAAAYPSFGALAMHCKSDLKRCVTDQVFKVNQYTNYYQDWPIATHVLPQVAALENGGFVVVWQRKGQFVAAEKYNIFYRIFQSNGNPLTSDLPIDFNTGAQNVLPRVAGLSGNRFVVAWELADGTLIQYKLFNENYQPQQTYVVSAITAAGQKDPHLLRLKDGGFFILWRVNAMIADYYKIYGNRYSSQGVAAFLNQEIFRAVINFNPLLNVKGIERDDGKLIVTFQYYKDENSEENYRLYGILSNSQGVQIGGPWLLSSYTTQYSVDLPNATKSGDYDLVKLPNNRFAVCFSTNNYGSGLGYEVLCKKFDSASDLITPLGSEFGLNQSTLGDAQNPSISSYYNGTFLIFWQEQPDGPGLHNDILTRLFDSSVTPISNWFNLKINYTGDERHPASTRLKNNALVVVWDDGGYTASKDIIMRIIP